MRFVDVDGWLSSLARQLLRHGGALANDTDCPVDGLIGVYPTVRGDDRYMTVLYRYCGGAVGGYVEKVIEDGRKRPSSQSFYRPHGQPAEYALDILLEIQESVAFWQSDSSFVIWHPFLNEHVLFWGDITPGDIWSPSVSVVEIQADAAIGLFSRRVSQELGTTVADVQIKVQANGAVARCTATVNPRSSATATDSTGTPLYLSQHHREADHLAQGLYATIIGELKDNT